MIANRTVKIKINIKVEEILPTVIAYTKAYNTVCRVGFDDKDKNGISLHNKTYHSLRGDLPSQLVCSSRVKATETLKSLFTQQKKNKQKQFKCPESSLCSIRYDQRSFNIWFDRGEASLLTLNGRLKTKFTVAEYYKPYLEWKRCSADLTIKNDTVFLHIVFSKEIDEPKQTGRIVGIDRGINNIVVTSENKFYSGRKANKKCKRIQKLRSKLQSVNSQSAKRHLKRLGRKENRFKTAINHEISRQIVNSLNCGDVLVLENLKNIRKNCKLRKQQRGNLHRWSFYQLEQFLTYKAFFKGIDIVKVNPAYTSQRCIACEFTSKSNRPSQGKFKCKECGYSLSADLLGSRNIQHLYSIRATSQASVNEPNVPLTRV